MRLLQLRLSRHGRWGKLRRLGTLRLRRRTRRAWGLLWRVQTLQPSLVTLSDLLPRLNSPVGSHGRWDSWWRHRSLNLGCKRLRHTRGTLIIELQHQIRQDVTGEHVHGNGTSLVAHLELEQRSDLLQCRVIRRLAASICPALAVMFHRSRAFVHERAKRPAEGAITR